MNKLKMLGIVTMSVLITACATNKNSNENKIPDLVSMDIKSYKIELSRDILTKIPECNFFLLASNNSEQKTGCSVALENKLTAYLSTSEKRKIDGELRKYGKSTKVDDINLSAVNEEAASLSKGKNISYLKELTIRNSDVYDVTTGNLEIIDSYTLTPYIIPNDQIIVKYIIENGTIIKGDSKNTGALLRVEGNKIVNDGQQDILSIVNLKGSSFLIKTITATKTK
jgi:hypothetical protein